MFQIYSNKIMNAQNHKNKRFTNLLTLCINVVYIKSIYEMLMNSVTINNMNETFNENVLYSPCPELNTNDLYLTYPELSEKCIICIPVISRTSAQKNSLWSNMFKK